MRQEQSLSGRCRVEPCQSTKSRRRGGLGGVRIDKQLPLSQPSRDEELRIYRPEIDGLRTIAVLSVVAFHLWPTRLQGGFVGVDVFFVISGYLIGGQILADLARNRFSLVRF